MSQNARVEIGAPSVGIDEHAGTIFRERVDGQIATDEVLFERHILGRMELKPSVTGRGLTLCSGEGVLLLRVRMQKDGEVAANGREARIEHPLRRGTHHNPVALTHG